MYREVLLFESFSAKLAQKGPSCLWARIIPGILRLRCLNLIAFLPEGTSALLFVVAELELQQLSSLSICDESSPVSTSSSFLFPIFLTSLQHFTSFWSSTVNNLEIEIILKS